jgi:hypothetical protein
MAAPTTGVAHLGCQAVRPGDDVTAGPHLVRAVTGYTHVSFGRPTSWRILCEIARMRNLSAVTFPQVRRGVRRLEPATSCRMGGQSGERAQT